MPHFPGDQLGPCEIVAPLGAAGLYRARDTMIDRDAGIQVLPARRFSPQVLSDWTTLLPK